MATYSEKLKDPRWQKKRLEVLNRDEFTCQICGTKKIELHIHHLSYRVGAEPWDYDNSNFATYCKVCHQVVEWFKTKKLDVKIIGGSCNGLSIDFLVFMYAAISKGMECVFFFEYENGELSLRFNSPAETITNLIEVFKTHKSNVQEVY